LGVTSRNQKSMTESGDQVVFVMRVVGQVDPVTRTLQGFQVKV